MTPEERKRILAETATRKIAEPAQKHEHQYMVVCSDMQALRWCTLCGKTWKLSRELRHFAIAWTWEVVFEP